MWWETLMHTYAYVDRMRNWSGLCVFVAYLLHSISSIIPTKMKSNRINRGINWYNLIINLLSAIHVCTDIIISQSASLFTISTHLRIIHTSQSDTEKIITWLNVRNLGNFLCNSRKCETMFSYSERNLHLSNDTNEFAQTKIKSKHFSFCVNLCVA